MTSRHAFRLVAVVALVLATLIPVGPAAATASFSDVEGTSYQQAVDALVEREILAGCSEDRFCPGDPLTRAQLASVLVRALDLPPTLIDYFDDDNGSTHEDAINALADAGYTEGCWERAYCPDDPVSRAEIAALIARSFDVPDTSERFFDDLDSVHAPLVEDVAAAGVAAGCTESMTSYCPRDDVLRWHAAVFVARVMDLVDRVEPMTLEERRQREAELEAERQAEEERRAEEQRKAEREKMWDDLAECESGGNWHINTGNGYYGGLQFSLSSWRNVGGSGYPHENTREEQIYRAEILLDRQGWDAWPYCSKKLGYQ